MTINSIPLRTLVSTIGLSIAIITAVAVPAGYFTVGHLNIAHILDFKADLNSRHVSKYIYSHNALWQFQRVRLAEVLEQTDGHDPTLRKRIVDSAGKLVLDEEHQIGAPVLVRGRPIVVNGETVGRVEMETSLQRLLAETGGVALLSILLGFGMFFAVRVFPTKVLDQTLGVLEKTNQRFDAALNNMSQGLIMMDKDERIVVCNDRYIEMYDLSRDVVKPGCTLSELFQHRAERGQLIRDPRKYRDELAARHATGKVQNWVLETGDGREISISDVPMSSGAWVSTHEDVTQQRRTERDRDRNRAFLDLIIDNVPSGIFVKNVIDRKYILVNRSGERFWGISREAMIGKTAGDVFPDAEAIKIEARDDELLQFGALSDEREILTPCDGVRSIFSRRLTIRNENNEAQYVLGVIDDVTERKAAEARIAHLAHFDPLTGLPNRTLFREQLEKELSFVRRGAQLAVLYLDLDNFKSINDTLGHPCGDELLKAVALRLRSCIRESDLIARLGGDEFAIVLTQLQDPKDAEISAQRLREAVTGASYDLNGHQTTTDLSIGIALSPEDGTDMDELVKHADLALYGAKAEGRANYRYFEPGMNARMKQRRGLEIDLRSALKNSEFELYFQPLINLQTGAIAGCEALLRWHHPERGMIPPLEFIPVAEETGLINAIGDWVLRRACVEAMNWPDHVSVAVNVSPVQFRNPALALTVVSSLAASGLPAHRLELEVTETALMQNNDATLATLHQIRDLGVRISMDDFGTGYSSLSYLRSFPFDKIKIDRSFIGDLSKGDDAVAIVQAILSLASSLKMTTTAEGVETAEQQRLLQATGCNEMQGYLFSPPRPAAEIAELFNACGKKIGLIPHSKVA